MVERAPDAKTVRDFHRHSDVDGSAKAIHHTLGSGPSQASPGNHTHDGGASAPIEGFSASDHNHDANYAKIDVPWIAMTPLLNSWVPYATGHRTPGYRKIGDIIECRGLVKNGTISTGTTGNIFIFPIGFRPTEQEIFIGASNTGIMRVDLFTDGSLRAIAAAAAGASNAFVSLANFRFSLL